MLVAFEVENWGSFRNTARLSLQASRERFNSDKSAKLSSMYGTTKILPVAAIYGANASGKSTLLEGLSVLRNIVVAGLPINQVLPVKPFKLDEESRNKPCRFKVEALIDGLIYEYEVSLKRADVVFESLFIRRTKNKELIFSRNSEIYNFGVKYRTHRIQLISENTRPNQLFLHNSVSQNASEFRPMYDWFNNSLIVLGANAQYKQYSRMLLQPDFLDFVNQKLRRYNTGIEGVVLEPIPREIIPAPQELIDDMVNSSTEDSQIDLQLRVNRPDFKGPEIFIIQVKDGKVETFKIKALHKCKDGSEQRFELYEESVGTQNLIEMLPVFFDLAASKGTEKIYLIDEFGKSFHSALTIDLICQHLNECSADTRCQLIFSTHDLVLMGEKILRRDELWFCEKDGNGESTLRCIGNHPGLRGDLDLLKNYQRGVLGGWPQFN